MHRYLVNTLHEINVSTGNGQAGKAHDSRVKVSNSSPNRRNFLLLHKYTLKTPKTLKLQAEQLRLRIKALIMYITLQKEK